MTLNACELEIDLFCRGLRIPPAVSLEGARGISRTRAGLGSGLEIVIPAKSWLKRDIWMNVPVVEPFAARSPYVLELSRAESSSFALVETPFSLRDVVADVVSTFEPQGRRLTAPATSP